ncbi:hypothetical protein MAPG_05272 [Magnaporthiopsis poae ATCC 64411]|uniref:Uncharacterized protein n=1 Tax=Magnaporthiopsis poae (strain ATCC 64411 / 73-15) TaxID=644358 RepID=A0A0C4DYY7_MAGP6|nr:hypothetical protein MAPG_05272 [Magnaporthiopsis poae ATCC 64411]
MIHVDLEQRLLTRVIDPQRHSLLFKVPPELRVHISTLALAPEFVLVDPKNIHYEDFRLRHNHDGNPDDDIIDELKAAPVQKCHTQRSLHIAEDFPESTGGNQGRKSVLSPHLLATCRRVFAEARLLIFRTERCIGPNGKSRFTRIRFRSSSLRAYHAFFGRELYALDFCGFPGRLQLSMTEHLRFSPMSLQTWRGYPPSKELLDIIWCPLLPRYIVAEGDGDSSIAPLTNLLRVGKIYRQEKELQLQQQQESSGHQSINQKSIKQETPVSHPDLGRPGWITPHPAGEHCSYPLRSWPRELVNMPRIQTLTLDFHCNEGQRPNFEAWLDTAVQSWNFPLNPKHQGYHYLSAQGNPIRKLSWRASVNYVGWLCEECSRTMELEGRDGCESHSAVRDKLTKGFGPRMYTWTVTWTRRRHNGPETYPYNGAIEVSEDDYQGEGDS